MLRKIMFLLIFVPGWRGRKPGQTAVVGVSTDHSFKKIATIWSTPKIMFLLILILAGKFSGAQEAKPPFWNDIQEFKRQDAIKHPPKNAVLFVGSSSFTNWKDVQNYFPFYAIINRGFGGSSIPDVIRYANDIIFPYQPKQIIIYCGENDLASSDAISANTVFQRFKDLFVVIRKKIPEVPVAYVSMKPSPSRKHLKPTVMQANSLIKNFLSGEKNSAFIDVYGKMLDDNGAPIKEIFIDDSLHMNAKGYQIWQKIIEPYLLK